MVYLLLFFAGSAAAEPEIYWQATDARAPITVAADQACRWRQGTYDVWLLRGNVYIQQGLTYARAKQAVLWIDDSLPEGHGTKVLAYLEGDVTLDVPTLAGEQTGSAGVQPAGTARISDRMKRPTWFGRFHTAASVKFDTPPPVGRPDVMPAILQRGEAAMHPVVPGEIRRTQFSEFPETEVLETLPAGTRRVRIFQRSDVPIKWDYLPGPSGDESVAVVTGGVTIQVDGVAGVGTVTMSTDRAVAWVKGDPLQQGVENLQADNLPLEIYMEGNIEFHQGDTVIHAHRMFYDVRGQVGVVLDAEVLAQVPDYRGMVRLRAAAVRMLDRSRYVAYDGMLTTSRLGVPRYSLRSGMISYQDVQTPVIDPATGAPLVDELGQPAYTHERLATANNNFLYVENVPVLYWPTMATDLEKPTYYINDLEFGNDDIFGTRAMVGLDLYQVLGIRNAPVGTEWNASVDWLSKRGLGYGTDFEYHRDRLFGLEGPAGGYFDAWAIDDHGVDNLGFGRRAVPPEKDYRGRVFWNHRQRLSNTMQITGELGLISDNNFLEEYYEQEWDEWKDQTTDLELRQTLDNRSWAVMGGVRLNDFFTQTEWLPRGDHFWLGQPLLGDRLTWYEHSSAAYARLRTAEPPPPFQMQPFELMPWFADVEGERLATRQEIDWPLELGPAKLVPYALGEFAHWGEDLTGEDLQRFYYQLGARASLPMWRVDPLVHSDVFNLNGMAHKIVFDAEFSFAESNRDVTELPLYDPLDDDNIEAFRAQFFSTTYGLPPGAPYPAIYDPRFYAIRSGVGGLVTSPVTEVVDDLTILRLGARQRWQTRRGAPGSERIVDWVTLDTNIAYYPNDGRDNFGQDFGLADYDFRWHVGDRVTLVSDGFADFFGGGLRTVSVGGFLNRPERGNLYMGYRSITGPVSSDVLAASLAYRMSPKWVATYGSSVDLSASGNVGQSLSITRIGESLLVTLGAKYDESKDNVSVALLVEPRFLPSSRLKRRYHLDVAPAGAYGLE